MGYVIPDILLCIYDCLCINILKEMISLNIMCIDVEIYVPYDQSAWLWPRSKWVRAPVDQLRNDMNP